MASIPKGILKNQPSWVQIAALLFLLVLFLIVGQFIALFIVEKAYQLNLREMQDLLIFPQEKYIGALKLMQFIITFFLFVVSAISFAWLLGEKDFLKICQKTGINSLILACTVIVFSTPIVSVLGQLNAGMKLPIAFNKIEQFMKGSEKNVDQLVQLMLKVKQPWDLIVNLVVIALLPALGEELIFRACIQQFMLRLFKNAHVAIIISAIIFSAAHMQFYGFLPRFFLGVVLGYLFYWSGSIWLSVTAHFFNNAMVVIAYTYMGANNKWLNSDSPDIFNIWWIFFSVFLVSIGLYLIWNQNETKSKLLR